MYVFVLLAGHGVQVRVVGQVVEAGNRQTDVPHINLVEVDRFQMYKPCFIIIFLSLQQSYNLVANLCMYLYF